MQFGIHWNRVDIPQASLSTNPIASRFTKDTLLTIITLYWVTGSIGSSFRSYFDDDQAPPLPRVDVLTGITLTPENAAYPREFAARTYTNIVQWKGPTSGGHFLALEEPDLLAAHRHV